MVRHQDPMARGGLPFQKSREVVRLHTPGKAELLSPSPMPEGPHDALTLALGVVVPAREFAPVVVARQGGAQRGEARSMTLPASPTGRSGRVQDPPSWGDLCRVGARPVRPSDSPGLFQGVQRRGLCITGRRLRQGLRPRSTQGVGRSLQGRFSRMRRTILRNEKSYSHRPAPRAPRASGEPAGHEVGRCPAIPRAGRVPGACRGLRLGQRWRHGPGRHATAWTRLSSYAA